MSWRAHDEGPPPCDFLEALIEEDEEEMETYINKEEDSDDEIEDLKRNSRVKRSRSPLRRKKREIDPKTSYLPTYMPPNVLIHVVGEEGERLREEGMNVDSNLYPKKDEETQQEEYWEPDEHALYESSVSDDDSDLIENKMSTDFRDENDRRVRIRGRVQRGRRWRGPRSLGGRRPRLDQGSSLEVGKPLEEIWLHDEDVPLEFREMVMDIVKRRLTRRQEMRERLLRKGHRKRKKGNAEEEGDSEDEEFQDATNGNVNPLLLEGDSHYFEWSSMDTFRGEEEFFKQERTGSVDSFSTAYDAFRSYWDDDIIQFMTDKTNQYASKVSSAAFRRDWFPTNSHEVLCLFAFWMMLGIIRMPTIISCFSTDPLLKTEVFRRIFTKNRYKHLTRVLLCDDDDGSSNKEDPAGSSDRLYNLRPILDHLNDKFQANYIPSKNICIDESLTLWKGKLNSGQCLRAGAANYGIKSFELCESGTGYLWSIFVFIGKQANSTAIVQKLVGPLLNKGYRLFMDHWYNSPFLARFLKRNGTDCVGTLRPNCTDVPELVTQAPLKQGQLVARHSGDVTVLSWQDKQRVTMISTCHGSGSALHTVPSKKVYRPLPFKPQVVLDYDKWMGGVDLKDQMLEPYLLERRKCSSWQLKLLKRLLNCSIHNARILLESSTQRPHNHFSFRLHLVDTILNKHLAHVARTGRQRYSSTRPSPFRLIAHTHWLVRNPQRECDFAKNRQTRVPCVVCVRAGRKSVKTPYRCEACNVALCVENCYKAYHS